MIYRTHCALLALLALVLSLISPAHAAPPKLIVGYFAAWGDSPEHLVANIPGDLLTHVNYAFGKIENGEIASGDQKVAPQHFEQLRRLKEKYPHLRTLIS